MERGGGRCIARDYSVLPTTTTCHPNHATIAVRGRGVHSCAFGREGGGKEETHFRSALARGSAE